MRLLVSALQRTAAHRATPPLWPYARRWPVTVSPTVLRVRGAHDDAKSSEGEAPTSKSSAPKSGPRSVAPPDAKTLLIVYHSLTDGARQMASAAFDAAVAADADGVHVRMVPARSAGAEDVLAAQAYIFATPENLASMAGAMKDFFDRAYYPVLGRANGRPYAALICAGSDGEGALRQLDRIALGWRLKKAAEGTIVCTHAQSPERVYAMKTIVDEDLERCREVGAAMAEGLALGVF